MNILPSGHHWIEELSAKHRPKIFLHELEYSSPVSYDNVAPVDRINAYINMIFYEDWANGGFDNASAVIGTGLYDDEFYYMDFSETSLQKQGPDKEIYSRAKVVENIVFVQYWMFYPSSTRGTRNAKKEDLVHEGDWEMMQVAVKLDTTNKILTPEGATASQHYWGKTFLWDKVEKANKQNPVIYIAGGSHATYFTKGEHRYKIIFKDYTHEPKEKAEEYILKPFEPVEVNQQKISWWLWHGHWGEFNRTWPPAFSGGPLGPKYRSTQDPGINIFDQPKIFYDTYYNQ